MSTPLIVGFRGATPYSWLKTLDTTDDYAFDLGVVVPGTSKSNFDAYWFNLGPSQLHDPQLSLVAHPLLDLGADADTIDVMKLAASVTDALAYATPAREANTSGWSVPLPDPLKPWEYRFRCGIIWDPPALATPGIIRKAFQWDGGYFPDTWDYMWAPLANEMFPWATMYDDPFMKLEGPGSHHEKIEAESGTLTGYRLNLWVPITVGDYIKYSTPYTGPGPWYDNVSNATGYIIKTNCRWYGSGEGYPFGIFAKDGTKQWKLRWNRSGSVYKIYALVADGFAVEQSYTINDAYREVKIVVQGTSLELWVDGVLGFTATLNLAAVDKYLQFGMLDKPPSGSHWGTAYVQYLKYYCGGTTEPIY